MLALSKDNKICLLTPLKFTTLHFIFLVNQSENQSVQQFTILQGVMGRLFLCISQSITCYLSWLSWLVTSSLHRFCWYKCLEIFQFRQNICMVYVFKMEDWASDRTEHAGHCVFERLNMHTGDGHRKKYRLTGEWQLQRTLVHNNKVEFLCASWSFYMHSVWICIWPHRLKKVLTFKINGHLIKR